MNTPSSPLEGLARLGLSQYEARCYLALLALGSGNGYSIAREAGVPTSKVYQALASLKQKGFADSNSMKKPVYRPADPDQVIEESRNTLAALEKGLKTIEIREPSLHSDALPGPEEIRRKMQTLLDSARGKVLVSGWPRDLVPFRETIEKKKGVEFFLLSYGPFECGHARIFLHRQRKQVKNEFRARWLLAVADGNRALAAFFEDNGMAQGLWIEDRKLANLVADHIRHDISINTVMSALPAKLCSDIEAKLTGLRNRLYF